MKIAVVGLWHLGCVYAASLASMDHDVVAVEQDRDVVETLKAGGLPVEEPGLLELIAQGVGAGRLSFTVDLSALEAADVVWLTVDTPVFDDDSANVSVVLETVRSITPFLRHDAVLAISSQLPLGTCRKIWNQIRSDRSDSQIEVVYSPENLRLGSALSSFHAADRIVIGGTSDAAVGVVMEAFTPLEVPILVMSLESAELAKHALNAFLAMSVAFANEIGRIAEALNADAFDVAKALKSDKRIGPRSYLSPGGPIAGGTLARDVRFLDDMADKAGVRVPVISSILNSNSVQKFWPVQVLTDMVKPATGIVLVLGLAYKSGSSTLRRSFGLDVAHDLADAGFEVRVFDALAEALPPGAGRFVRIQDLEAAVENAKAIVICAMEGSISELPRLLKNSPRSPIIIDAIGALASTAEFPASTSVRAPGKGVKS